MAHVKICGLSTVEHALAAAAAGADWLGFIFAPSRRQVSVAQASTIIAAVRQATTPGVCPAFVGVFVNDTPARMLAIAAECQLNLLQLSGDEPASIRAELGGYPLIKTLRLHGASNEHAWRMAAPDPQLHLHIDAHVAGSYGGAGVIGDWQQAAILAQQGPIMLAGGLTPTNVTEAITMVRPWAVDVSSGVERDGRKDTRKIQAFIAAAKQEVLS